MHAYETQLEYSGTVGHAVVVECGQPWRFVFWDKAQYVGCVDVGQGVWFTSEWGEANSPNDLHCYEPIMDKQLRWSQAQILENGPARVRVKWRYALCDMRYRIFHGDSWADEIFTIYPDGIAVREVVLWPGRRNHHGGNSNMWQIAEWILVNAAGTSPLDFLQMPTPFTLWNGSGDRIDVPWPLPASGFEPFCDYHPQVADWPMYVGRINLRGAPSPFVTVIKNQALFPFVSCFACGGNHPDLGIFPGTNLYNVYKHWPVTDMEDFILWVPAGDEIGQVATHTSFMDVNFALRRSGSDYIPTPDPGATWYLLVGATPEGTDGAELEAMAHAYSQPADIEVERDPGEPEDLHRGRVLLEGYDYALRAYTFRKKGNDQVSLTMTPSAPQINPVFLINGWTAPEVRVTVNDRPLDAAQYRSQIYGHDLTVWVEGRFDQPTKFSFEA